MAAIGMVGHDLPFAGHAAQCNFNLLVRPIPHPDHSVEPGSGKLLSIGTKAYTADSLIIRMQDTYLSPVGRIPEDYFSILARSRKARIRRLPSKARNTETVPA